MGYCWRTPFFHFALVLTKSVLYFSICDPGDTKCQLFQHAGCKHAMLNVKNDGILAQMLRDSHLKIPVNASLWMSKLCPFPHEIRTDYSNQTENNENSKIYCEHCMHQRLKLPWQLHFVKLIVDRRLRWCDPPGGAGTFRTGWPWPPLIGSFRSFDGELCVWIGNFYGWVEHCDWLVQWMDKFI